MSSVGIVQQRLESVLENNILADGFWSVQPYLLVDLSMVWSTALRAKSIVASTFNMNTQGRGLCAAPKLALVFPSKGPRSTGGVGATLEGEG